MATLLLVWDVTGWARREPHQMPLLFVHRTRTACVSLGRQATPFRSTARFGPHSGPQDGHGGRLQASDKWAILINKKMFSMDL